MNFFANPSLTHIALVHVAATLWNQHDVKDLLKNFSCLLSVSKSNSFPYPHHPHKKHTKWKKIENTVINKVSEFTIPTSLKEKLLGYIQALGIQILRWMEYHFRFCCFDLGLLNNFCWTPHGTLDRKKTAEMLIRDETIHVTVRYRLACAYCLEDSILTLWDKIPFSCRNTLYCRGNCVSLFERELLQFWGRYVREKKVSGYRISNSIYLPDSYMFNCASKAGNIAATKYFLQKLVKQKYYLLDEALINAAINAVNKSHEGELHYTDSPQEYHSELFCFILSQINYEQQMQIFEVCPIQALQCFLDWPWQKTFVEIASRLMHFLPNSNEVLKIITLKVDMGYNDYNYQEVFRDVWQQMTAAQKLHIINDSFSTVLNSLLEIKDKESIKFIFLDINIAERKKFIFSDLGQDFCKHLILCEDLDLLKFFILFGTSSKDEILKFKNEFQEERISSPDLLSKNLFEKNRSKLKKFFQLVDDLAHRYDKRKSSDDGSSKPAKKFGNIELKMQDNIPPS